MPPITTNITMSWGLSCLCTQARFVAFRFPWTPSKSAHNRTYDGYTNHGPEITKSRTSGCWKPETCFGRFDTFSGEMVGNLEVGLIGPQFKPSYRQRTLWKEKYPLWTSLKRKERPDKGERFSADLLLSANSARCSEKQRPLLNVCQIAH